jgi:hypothetical protein
MTRHQWLMPVIVATQEAEIRRIQIRRKPLANSWRDPHLENTQHKTGSAEWLKW